MKHSSARNIIERDFGLLKIRWAILRSYSYFSIKTQSRIITACCLLHNLIKREMPVDLLEHLLDENQSAPPPLVDEYIDVVEALDQWYDWRATLATPMYNEWKTNRGHGNVA